MEEPPHLKEAKLGKVGEMQVRSRNCTWFFLTRAKDPVEKYGKKRLQSLVGPDTEAFAILVVLLGVFVLQGSTNRLARSMVSVPGTSSHPDTWHSLPGSRFPGHGFDSRSVPGWSS